MLRRIQIQLQSIQPSEIVLTRIGFLAGILFIGYGTHTGNIILVAAAMALVGLSVLYPRLLRTPYRVAFVCLSISGWFLFRLFLIVVYYFIVTPACALLRVAGRDPLALRRDTQRRSYWEKSANTK